MHINEIAMRLTLNLIWLAVKFTSLVAITSVLRMQLLPNVTASHACYYIIHT